jgi:hypothetical protein
MKNILYILILFAYGCQSTTAQKVDESVKEDQAFEELMKSVESNTLHSMQVQAKAKEAQTKIVQETVQKITTLKEEVTTLKTELKDVKEKLNDVVTDTGISFNILAIPKDKKDR